MTTTTAALIAEAKRLDAEATPGPWVVNENDDDRIVQPGITRKGDGTPKRLRRRDMPIVAITPDGACGDPECCSQGESLSVFPADAAFIARSRTLLPQLADALVALEGQSAARLAGWNNEAIRRQDAEARLAKVLPLAVDTIQVVRGGEWVGGKRCRSCYAEWADGYTSQGHAYSEPRTCAPDCPARPMEPTDG